jgi:crotonobetainyl-CoA:carnitine CoA-transferase CaiB-like acyl-CoA transferase
VVIHALDGVRVLELDLGLAGKYAGRFLTELGADVHWISSGPNRNTRVSDAEMSWLDLGKLPAHAIGAPLKSLCGTYDVVLHEYQPEELAGLGIHVEQLADTNPDIIVLALTPFGSTGPLRGWRSCPLTDLHAGGEGWELVADVSSGDTPSPVRPPVMTGGDGTEAYCGLMAAVGVVAALRRAELTGVGNLIDLSKQEASMWPARVELSAFPNAGVSDRRRTRERMPGGVLPTSDGWVEIMPFEERMWEGLMEAMSRPSWASHDRYRDRMSRLALASELNPLLAGWTRRHTAREVSELLQRHGCPAYEVMSVDKLSRSPQYAARGYFVDAELPGYGRRRVPTTPFTGPKRGYDRDNHSGGDLRPATASAGPASGSVPAGFLDGVRVLDLTFNRAGPSCTAAMAALGAEVIRVESNMRIDPNRMRRSVAGKVVYADAASEDLETRWSFASINMGKKSIQLNLQAPQMRDVFARLVAVSDVVVESFTPGTIERYGIGFDALTQWREDVILLSINGFGRGGPHEGYRAYADIFAAAGGLQLLTGYPDEPPMQFVGRLDSVVGSFGLLGALAALLERGRTGRGQHVEVSAAEAVTTLLGTALIDYIVSGHIAGRTGNSVPAMAPHGCYPCQGDDRWVAIAVADDAEWHALCACMGQPDLTHDLRFASMAARKHNEAILDTVVSSWTRSFEPYALAHLLQDAGIAAVPSMRPDQLFTDDHLNGRSAWVHYHHPVQGERYDLRLPWRFSDGACRYDPAPLFGEHDTAIYGDLLGVSPDEISHLTEARVIF